MVIFLWNNALWRRTLTCWASAGVNDWKIETDPCLFGGKWLSVSVWREGEKQRRKKTTEESEMPTARPWKKREKKFPLKQQWLSLMAHRWTLTVIHPTEQKSNFPQTKAYISKTSELGYSHWIYHQRLCFTESLTHFFCKWWMEVIHPLSSRCCLKVKGLIAAAILFVVLHLSNTLICLIWIHLQQAAKVTAQFNGKLNKVRYKF